MEAAAASAEAPAWYQQPCMLGVDEAGRGPVLGPMVYACAYCAVSEKEALKKKEYADSKTLTEEKRERLLSQIDGDPGMSYIADVLDASFIAARMLSREKTSLNVLASDSTCSLIDSALARGVNLTEVYIDTVGDAGRYQDLLSRRFPGIAFTVCPKADALYPIVSAASIVAKVRFSWATCTPILDARAVPVKWECEEEGGQQQLNFGSSGAKAMLASSGAGRHSYFRARKLQRVQAGF